MGYIKASANDLDGRKLFNWKIFVLLNKYMKPIYIYNDCFADQVLRMPKCHVVQHKWIQTQHIMNGFIRSAKFARRKTWKNHANILYGKIPTRELASCKLHLTLDHLVSLVERGTEFFKWSSCCSCFCCFFSIKLQTNHSD